MRILSWLITLPLLLVIIVFVLGNHGEVTLSFWPFGVEVTMPLALMALGLLLIGMLLGGFFVLIGTLHYRFESCRLRREVAALNNRLAEALDQLAASAAPLIPGKHAPYRNLFNFKWPWKKKRL